MGVKVSRMAQHLPPAERAPEIYAAVPSVVSEDVLVERFEALKRQIPLLYAIAIANLAGFLLIAPDLPDWTMVCALTAGCLILYRLFYWHRLAARHITPAQVDIELQRNLRSAQIISVFFVTWALSVLAVGEREQQQYVILFGALAAIGCSVALASVPDAARQPLTLLALPIAVWALLTGEIELVVVGLSLIIVIFLVSRILVQQDQGFRQLVSSKAMISVEREKLRASEYRYELVSRATDDLIWDWDLATGQIVWNNAIRTQLGFTERDIQPTIEWWVEHIHPDHKKRVTDHIFKLMERGDHKFEDEYLFRKADGTYAHMYDRGFIIRDGKGAAVRMVGAMQDLTERKLTEENLLRAATLDPLTNLPNRKLFMGELEVAVRGAVDDGRWSSLLLLDLDEFKQVNDMMGHDAGDALLKELASRLNDSIPEDSVAARLGGDEFGVILSGVASASRVEACAEVVLARLREPFTWDGRILDCGATIGAAMIPFHGKTPDEVLKSADMALYAAKTNRRGSFLLFQAAHRAELQKRAAMRNLAKSALRDSQIVPFYQSQVCLANNRVVGFEALLRWRQPGRGIQLPGSITAAFDDLELSSAISLSMIAQVLADVRLWLDQGLPFEHVALNASAADFRRDGFAEILLELLHDKAIPASCIQLEVTESVFLGRGAEHVDHALKMLSSAGVTIALDDFGTGYASLSHLKQFPVDIIKIDQSFIRDMEVNPEDDVIVRAVINLGKSLGIKVVAEGIETHAQARHLLSLGCDLGQGFLYSKAVPANEVCAMLGGQASVSDSLEPARLPPARRAVGSRFSRS